MPRQKIFLHSNHFSRKRVAIKVRAGTKSRTAQVSGSKSFDPSMLPNMAGWFRFGVGITSAAGAVSQWNDQSGNTRHLKQTTGAAQPTLQSNGAIQFDGSSDFLKCDPFTLNQPETIYLLMKQITWTNNNKVVDGNTANSGLIWQSPSTPTIAIYASSSVSQNTALVVNTYGAVCGVINGAASITQINNTLGAVGDAGATNMGGFTLGAQGDGLSSWSNIEVKEVIIYSAAHDAATRATVIAYLNQLG